MAAARSGLGSHFASPERAEPDQFASQVEAAAHSPLLDWVLMHVGGFLAVLNEERQIVALNDSLLTELGVVDPAATLGLRPGEALQCVHAREMEAGCGTSEFCSSCGAAITIVGCLQGEGPRERTCALTVTRDGVEQDLCLRVRAAPLRVGAWRFVLLFLQDISAQEWRGALERTFFHDMNNLIAGICGLSESLAVTPEAEREELTRRVVRLSDLLGREVAIQRALSHGARGEYRPAFDEVSFAEVQRELQSVFRNHGAAADRALVFSKMAGQGTLRTDFPLLMRVLTNMLVNALEATPRGGQVRLRAEAKGGRVAFSVWNDAVIPPAVRLRVFQRHFSTKEGAGRGLGTYAMKLFGEKFLGGTVSFTSAAGEGTTFRLELPARPRAN